MGKVRKSEKWRNKRDREKLNVQDALRFVARIFAVRQRTAIRAPLPPPPRGFVGTPRG